MATTITANGINFPDGSASAPSIGGTDTNTGLFTGSDIVGFATGGTERLRITSAGVLSLNDSTPETWATLQINNQSTHNAAQVLIRGADQAQIILRDDTGGTDQKCTTIRNDQGALIFGQHNDAFSAFSEKLRIKADGFLEHYGSASFTGAGSNYLRIGSTNAGGATLGLDGDSNGDGSGADYCMIQHATDGNLKIIADNPANAANIIFYSNSTTERLRIDSSGHVGIGRASGLELLDVKGVDNDSFKFSASTYGGGHFKIAGADGTIGGVAGPYAHTTRFKTKSQNSNGGNGAERDALILHHEGWSGLHIASFPTGKLGIGDTSPDCSLHVNSGAADDALKIESTDASVNLILRDSVCTSLIQQNNTTLMIGSDSANTTAGSIIAFYVDGTEQARIANGISFNGDTATQNMLNDYEEGVHIVTDAHTNWIWGSGTNAYRTVAYTKIGRQVTLTGQIVCRADGEANGTLISISLPFVCLNDVSGQDQGQSGGACRLYQWAIPNPDDCITVMVGTYDGLSYAHIHASYSNAVSQTIGGDDGAYIQFSLTYMTN